MESRSLPVLSKRLTYEHHEFGKLKSNGSGGRIRTWVDIPIPLLTPCIVMARTFKVKTRVHSKPGTPSTWLPRHQLTPQMWCVQQRLIASRLRQETLHWLRNEHSAFLYSLANSPLNINKNRIVLAFAVISKLRFTFSFTEIFMMPHERSFSIKSIIL